MNLQEITDVSRLGAFCMVNFFPITPKKIKEIIKEINEYPKIAEYFGKWIRKALEESEPRAYPIIKQFLTRNYEYLELIDQVLNETSDVKGFFSVVKHSKNKSEFYDELSILKLGRILKRMNYDFEFMSPTDEPKPDIVAEIMGKKFFFEVKHLTNVDEAENLLFNFFNEYPSKSSVWIKLDDVITKSQIDDCIGKIKSTIEAKKEVPQHLSLGYANVEIRPSKFHERTSVFIFPRVESIPFERTKFKISTTFCQALKQLRSTPPESLNFVVYDVDNWRIGFDDMARVFYGDITTDLTPNSLELQKRLYELKKWEKKIHHYEILNALKRDYDLLGVLTDFRLIPMFSYSSQNGLFFSNGSEEINGIIVFRGDRKVMIQNPFVKEERFEKYHMLSKFMPFERFKP